MWSTCRSQRSRKVLARRDVRANLVESPGQRRVDHAGSARRISAGVRKATSSAPPRRVCDRHGVRSRIFRLRLNFRQVALVRACVRPRKSACPITGAATSPTCGFGRRSASSCLSCERCVDLSMSAEFYMPLEPARIFFFRGAPGVPPRELREDKRIVRGVAGASNTMRPFARPLVAGSLLLGLISAAAAASSETHPALLIKVRLFVKQRLHSLPLCSSGSFGSSAGPAQLLPPRGNPSQSPSHHLMHCPGPRAGPSSMPTESLRRMLSWRAASSRQWDRTSRFPLTPPGCLAYHQLRQGPLRPVFPSGSKGRPGDRCQRQVRDAWRGRPPHTPRDALHGSGDM